MKKIIVRLCKRHGDTEFVLEKSSGYYRCRKCRVENVTNRRHKVKRLLVEEFGGKCSKCGYNKCLSVLEFHHTDPTKKDFGIAEKGITRGIEFLRQEAKKCVLLCANCHGELHDFMGGV